MHLDPVAILIIIWAVCGIIFRRWSGRQYVIVRRMMGPPPGPTSERRGELLSVVIALFVLAFGISMLFVET